MKALMTMAMSLALLAGAASAANRYEVAGFDNAAEFEALFKKFQTAVAANDQEALLDLIDLPIIVNYARKGKPPRTVEIGDEKLLARRWNEIFTQDVKAALARQKIEELFVNYQGVMVGDGIVWFAVVGEGDDVSTQLTLNLPGPKKDRGKGR